MLSAGSIASIASAGALLSIASAGSILSVRSSFSLLSYGCRGSILSWKKDYAVLNRPITKRPQLSAGAGITAPVPE